MNNYKITEFKFKDGKLPKEQQVGWSFFVREGTMDNFIVSEVIVNDVYKIKNMLQFLDINIPKTIVDLGAQIGGFTKYCAVSFPYTKIYSYEGLEENFEILKMNTSGYSNVKIENKIVCGNKSPTQIVTPANKNEKFGFNTGGTQYSFSDDKDGQIFNNTTNLKKIIEENNIEEIDFLKIDIEGSEYEVLKYAKETGVLSKVKCMVCELHVNPKKGRFFGQFLEYLDGFSYLKCVQIDPESKNSRIVFAIK